MNKLILPALFLCLCLLSCQGGPEEEHLATDQLPSTPDIPFTVTNSFLHDKSLFTEGLVMHKGNLYESTGSPGELPDLQSMVGIDNLTTGSFTQKIRLDKSKYFGEGIVFMNNRLYQLTYKNKIGFVYDAATFKLLKTFPFASTEGWGLTTDGKTIIMSDGSDKLTWLDPDALHVVRELRVTDNGVPRDSLNELEYIKGFIYANIWQNNVIVKIDPASGKVTGHMDISPLAFKMRVLNPACDVSNGIAYDSAKDRMYVSGKLWPYIFELKW